MHTIIEAPTFEEDAKEIWQEEERGAFCAWLAANPEAGKVIPGSGGCRKVRWPEPVSVVECELSTSISLLMVKSGFWSYIARRLRATYLLIS
jgi:hypothetical protein